MKFRSFLLSCVSTLYHVRRSLKYFRSRSQQCVNIKLKKTFFVVVAGGYEKKKNPSCRFKCVFVVLMYLIKVDTFFLFIPFIEWMINLEVPISRVVLKEEELYIGRRTWSGSEKWNRSSLPFHGTFLGSFSFKDSRRSNRNSLRSQECYTLVVLIAEDFFRSL